MTAPAASDLQTAAAPSLRHLFHIRAEQLTPHDGGESALGRRIWNAPSGGLFMGERLRGEVVPGGGDWMLVRRDGVMAVDARVCLRTDDGAVIHMSYGGRIRIPESLLAEARAPSRRRLIDPSAYYFRTTPVFETGSARYGWLNDIVCVGVGKLLEGGGVSYEVWEVT
jgi:hypothetical protein